MSEQIEHKWTTQLLKSMYNLLLIPINYLRLLLYNKFNRSMKKKQMIHVYTILQFNKNKLLLKVNW